MSVVLFMEPSETELWSMASKKRKLGYKSEELQEIMSVYEGELKLFNTTIGICTVPCFMLSIQQLATDNKITSHVDRKTMVPSL